MRKISMLFGLLAVATMLLAGSGVANAYEMYATGCVYCDANGSNTLDPSDTPLAGVGVNVTRTSSEWAGEVYPGATDGTGCFMIMIHWPYTTWAESLDAATLPADATFIDPGANSHLFTISEDPWYIIDTRNWLVGSETCLSHFCGDGVLDAGEECDDGNTVNGDGCSATCTTEQRLEGCTPGYWKQDQHFDSWVLYTPQTLFSSVFDNAFPGKTLLQVLNLGGGGLNALGRHAVAALLNAQNPQLNFGLGASDVVTLVNTVYPGTANAYLNAKDILEGYNVRFCPLD